MKPRTAKSLELYEIMLKRGYPKEFCEQNVKEKVCKADEEIVELKVQLEKRMTGKHMDATVPEFVGRIGKSLYDSNVRKTANLSVSDACIGCGLCAKKCPVNAIEMKDKKPALESNSCRQCRKTQGNINGLES